MCSWISRSSSRQGRAARSRSALATRPTANARAQSLLASVTVIFSLQSRNAINCGAAEIQIEGVSVFTLNSGLTQQACRPADPFAFEVSVLIGVVVVNQLTFMVAIALRHLSPRCRVSRRAAVIVAVSLGSVAALLALLKFFVVLSLPFKSLSFYCPPPHPPYFEGSDYSW